MIKGHIGSHKNKGTRYQKNKRKSWFLNKSKEYQKEYDITPWWKICKRFDLKNDIDNALKLSHRLSK
jgi:hypothetical protein